MPAEDARVDLAVLRVGEDATPVPPGMHWTPGQMLHRFNHMTPDERLAWLSEAAEYADAAFTCAGRYRESHAQQIANLKAERDHARHEYVAAGAALDHATDRLSDMVDDAGFARPDDLADALDSIHAVLTNADLATARRQLESLGRRLTLRFEHEQKLTNTLAAITDHVDWKRVTYPLTTEQRKTWADAIDDGVDPDDHKAPKADRWWECSKPGCARPPADGYSVCDEHTYDPAGD